jgi:hypothetical protein
LADANIFHKSYGDRSANSGHPAGACSQPRIGLAISKRDEAGERCRHPDAPFSERSEI